MVTLPQFFGIINHINLIISFSSNDIIFTRITLFGQKSSDKSYPIIILVILFLKSILGEILRWSLRRVRIEG